jgi:guanylate kinase
VARAVVITGPSGVGKGTLIRSLRERMPDLELSVSATTRRPRAGETHGVDYHFLAPEEFARRVEAGEFVEHADYAGARYGTLRSELETRTAAGRPVVLEIELQGARQVRETLPSAVQVFIAPPSLEALRAMALAPGSGQPWLGGGSGGLSGPAIRSVALAQVAIVAARVGIPIIGMGGITRGNHARDLLEAGATIVAVGTESFRDPAAAGRIRDELKSLQIAETPSTCVDESEPQVEVDMNSPD